MATPSRSVYSRYPAMLSRLRKVRFTPPSIASRTEAGSTRFGKTTESGREAKFYRLTKKGRAQLELETANWERLTQAVSLILNLSNGGAK